jgi:DNA-binding MarR family transcriptional regulator
MTQAIKHLTLATYETCTLEAKAHRVFTASVTESLSRYDLSIPQWSVLGVLNDRGDQRPFQIAEVLNVRPPVATALINELEAKKLIIRKVHASDNRATLIVLTRQGKQLVSKVERHVQKDLRILFGDITVPELSVYMRVLTKLAAKTN